MDSTFSKIKLSILKNSDTLDFLHWFKHMRLKTASSLSSKRLNADIWLIISMDIPKNMIKKWFKKLWKKCLKICMLSIPLDSFTETSNLRTFCSILTWVRFICFWLILGFLLKKILQEIQSEKNVQEHLDLWHPKHFIATNMMRNVTFLAQVVCYIFFWQEKVFSQTWVFNK